MDDICCIGHITLDRIVTPQKEVYMPGGTTFYFSHGISHLLNSSDAEVKYRLVASLAEAEYQSVEDIRALGINVDIVPSKKTVFFENIYGENQNNRKQRVRAKADPFTVEAVKDVKAKYICLGSLLADDFSLDVVKYLCTKGTVVMDAQGYLRKVQDGKVYACDWENKFEFFKYIDILKVNEYEVEVLTDKMVCTPKKEATNSYEINFSEFEGAEFGIGSGNLWLQCKLKRGGLVFCSPRKSWKSEGATKLIEAIDKSCTIKDMKAYKQYTGPFFFIHMFK